VVVRFLARKAGGPVTQEAAMAGRPTSTNGATDDVLIEASASVTGTAAETRPLPKKAKRQVRKLTKKLGAARATEAKRMRQSAKAHKRVDKRERQVARATADVASIEGRIRGVTDGAEGTKPAPRTSPMPPKPPRPARRTAAPPSRPKPARPSKATPPPKPPASA
jgi:hypothetical protein